MLSNRYATNTLPSEPNQASPATRSGIRPVLVLLLSILNGECYRMHDCKLSWNSFADRLFSHSSHDQAAQAGGGTG